MTLGEHLHYYTIGNPISKAIIAPVRNIFTKETVSKIVAYLCALGEQFKMYLSQKALLPSTPLTPPPTLTPKIEKVMSPLWELAGRNLFFVRLAGLSGASAVVLGAIGAHSLAVSQEKAEMKRIFETANHFHFFHSLALLGVPISRRPLITGSLMILGTALFSGVCYYRAFTGDKQYSRYAPLGGGLLILAWLSLML